MLNANKFSLKRQTIANNFCSRTKKSRIHSTHIQVAEAWDKRASDEMILIKIGVGTFFFWCVSTKRRRPLYMSISLHLSLSLSLNRVYAYTHCLSNPFCLWFGSEYFVCGIYRFILSSSHRRMPRICFFFSLRTQSAFDVCLVWNVLCHAHIHIRWVKRDRPREKSHFI